MYEFNAHSEITNTFMTHTNFEIKNYKIRVIPSDFDNGQTRHTAERT